MITKVLAFIGGLSALLDVIIPLIIQLFSHVKQRKNQSIPEGIFDGDLGNDDQFFFI